MNTSWSNSLRKSIKGIIVKLFTQAGEYPMMPKIVPVAMKPKDSIRRWKLIEKWKYKYKNMYISIPKGFIFDGASIPRVFTAIYSPTGYLFLAALVHDFCYQMKRYHSSLDKNCNKIIKIEITRAQSDYLFKEIGKIEYPNHRIKTQVAYWALKIGGWVAWNAHRRKDK